MLLNLAAVSGAEDRAALWGFIRRYAPEASPETHPQLDEAAGFAVRYFADFVKPGRVFRAPDARERAAMADLRERLAAWDGGADAEALQSEVFAVGKAHGFEPLRDWFTALYEVLLGASQGPRFGGFVALYGVDETVALIDAALAGSARARPGRRRRRRSGETSPPRATSIRTALAGRPAMLRALFRALVVAAALVVQTAAAPAQDSAAASVIRDQLDAFLADDVDRAFSFASPTIKRLFGTPGNFGLMVQRGYPMVWRHDRVEFLEARPEGAAVYQNVLIVDAAGVPHVLEYMMIETDAGWQINGVRILDAPPVGV